MPFSSITAIFLVVILIHIATTSAYPLHEPYPLSLRPHLRKSDIKAPQTAHGIDNVGPALYNATQDAIKRGEHILANYTSVLHGVAIPTGLAASFFGYFLLAPVLFLAAFVTGGGACFVAVSTIFEAETPTTAWISIGAMLLGGALFGFVAMRALSIGMFAVGASLGVVFASALRTTVIADTFPKDPRTAFIVTAVVLGLLLGLMALFFEKHMLIFSTAYAGACACVFGIGHFAGHFPKVTDLSKVEAGKFDGWVVLYLLLTLGLGTAGMFFQFWLAQDKPMPQYAPYDRRSRRGHRRRYERPGWTDDDDDWDGDVYVERAPPPPRRKRGVPNMYPAREEYVQTPPVEHVYVGATAKGVAAEPADSAGGELANVLEGSWSSVQQAGNAFNGNGDTEEGMTAASGVLAEPWAESSVSKNPFKAQDGGIEEDGIQGRADGMVYKGDGFDNEEKALSDDGVVDGVVQASPTLLVDVPLGNDAGMSTVKV